MVSLRDHFNLMIIQLVFRVTILFLYPIIIIIIINFPRENISFYNFFRAEKFNKVLLIIIIGEMKRWKVYQVLSIGFRSRKEFRKNYSLESTRVLLRLSLSSSEETEAEVALLEGRLATDGISLFETTKLSGSD